MFRTSKCSSSGRCVHAVLCYFFQSTWLLTWMHESNTIKLHVQVFLRMNIWMFEKCRKHYNWIKTLLKKSEHFVCPYYVTKLCEIKYQTTNHNPAAIKQTVQLIISVNLNNQRHIAKHVPLNTEISTSRNVWCNWLQKQSVLAWTGFSRLIIGPKVSADEHSGSTQGRQLVISRIIISSNSRHDTVERKLNLLSNYLTTVKR